MKQNMPLFIFEKGDFVTASDVNSILADAYNVANFLTHENMGTLSTGQFEGDDVNCNKLFPNYCGKIESRKSVNYYDAGLFKLINQSNIVLDLLGE